ncbi:hypothetical protein [Bacteroides acidifaciens]|uniref:hypothetical protein n=1 Tax=Bacteroides acidifaciens TaxID=85831 RepID=UPI002598091F|nr:hypothetical protein [Bacteroides acidifaciens]
MELDKTFFEKVFSNKRMEKYFSIHPDNEALAITHYRCNVELSKAFYPCISTLEIALRNAIVRELQTLFGREDWYTQLSKTSGLANLNHYITTANKQISGRRELATPSKIIAELTISFWVSLFNSEYKLILWQALRRAFPYMPKPQRQRKNVSAPLNRFRRFRNRVFHHEPICWDLRQVQQIHNEILQTIGWINKDLPTWIGSFDPVEDTLASIRDRLSKE